MPYILFARTKIEVVEVVRKTPVVDNSSDEEKKPAEKPVSLKPLEFEEALEDMLRVKPDTKDENRGRRGDANRNS